MRQVLHDFQCHQRSGQFMPAQIPQTCGNGAMQRLQRFDGPCRHRIICRHANEHHCQTREYEACQVNGTESLETQLKNEHAPEGIAECVGRLLRTQHEVVGSDQ